MTDDDGMVPAMTAPLTKTLLDHIKSCNHVDETNHQEALAGAEMADMLVSAFKLGLELPEARDLFDLMITAMVEANRTPDVIFALVTCITRADGMFEAAVEKRAAMAEADPELAERMRVAFEAADA